MENVNSQKMEIVRINIKTIKQLFNSFDPSPFIEKDLDHDAIEYLVSSFNVFHHNSIVKIVVHLPESQKGKFKEFEIKDAIHHYFQYEKSIEERDIQRKIKEGQKSLTIGLSFLFICLGIGEWLALYPKTFLLNILSEALLILGWVAMWKPISNVLYDWWPLMVQKNVYEKISRAEIDFVYEK